MMQDIEKFRKNKPERGAKKSSKFLVMAPQRCPDAVKLAFEDMKFEVIR